MSYASIVDPILRDNNLDNTILDDIKISIMPYYDVVSSVYKPNEIILLCGEDIHHCNCNNFLKKGHNIFVREL